MHGETVKKKKPDHTTCSRHLANSAPCSHRYTNFGIAMQSYTANYSVGSTFIASNPECSLKR